MQLGALLAGAPERYPKGTRINQPPWAPAAPISGRSPWALKGRCTCPWAGARPQLQRLPRRDHDYDQKAELWLAPSLGYLPARIQITQSNGDFAVPAPARARPALTGPGALRGLRRARQHAARCRVKTPQRQRHTVSWNTGLERHDRPQDLNCAPVLSSDLHTDPGRTTMQMLYDSESLCGRPHAP